MALIRSIWRWIWAQPFILLSLTPLFWGGNVIAGKFAVDHISPFLLTSMRWVLAVALLMPFAWSYLKRDWPIIRRHLPFLFFLGAMGFGVFNNMMYLSLAHTSALNNSIIQASLPLTVFVLNFILYKIKATQLQILGFGLTVIGVLLTSSQGSLDILKELEFNYGDILILIAIFIYGYYSVLLKKKPDIHWLSLIAVLACSAAIISMFFTIYEAQTNTIIWPDNIGWVVVIYAGIFPSLVAQTFWIRGVELIGSNRAGIFINIVPIFAATLAILLLGEKFHFYHAIALTLVIGGVWIAQVKRKATPA